MEASGYFVRWKPGVVAKEKISVSDLALINCIYVDSTWEKPQLMTRERVEQYEAAALGNFGPIENFKDVGDIEKVSMPAALSEHGASR